MSFAEKDYSLLAVSVCKTREERMREEKNRVGGSATAMLAKKLMKKITSILRSRSRYSRRKSTLVFNYSAYNPPNCEMAQCKYGADSEPQRFCPDLSASSRRHF